MHRRDEKYIQNFDEKTWKKLLGRPRYKGEDNIKVNLMK